MATKKLVYPATRTEGILDRAAGVDFPDPYRWLEGEGEGEGEEVGAWQRAQAQLAADNVRQWPHFDALRERVALFSTERIGSVPRFAGGRWFRGETPQGASQSSVFVAEEPFGPARLLFDPATENPDTPPFVSWIVPAPDGKVLAIGVCADGSENNTIRLIDVTSGELLPGAPKQVLMDNWTGGAEWLPDSSGFYYMALTESTFDNSRAIYLHDMATCTQEVVDVELPTDQDWGLVSISDDGRHVVLNHGLMTPRPIAIRAVDEAEWRPFATEVWSTLAGHVVGDRYIAVTDLGAARGRVVAIPLDSPTPNDSKTWEELIPESDAVIRSVVAAGEHLYISEFVESYARVRIADLEGRIVGEVPLPDRGAVAELPFPLMNLASRGQPDGFLFSFSSLTASWGVYRYRPGDDAIETLKAPDVCLDSAVVDDYWAISADGTRILYHTVRQPGVEQGAALLYAYGGFNAPHVPQFPGPMAAFADAGGIFVSAHLRGGGEFGREWWYGGRRENKQNCYADLYAVAEDLIARGLTTSDRLAVTGGSNGGLMAGVAVTQRPDLWKVVVPRVPILDLIGALREPYGFVACVAEFADPRDPEDVKRMAGFSPYHLVEDDTAYPAVFMVAGDTDPRCPPWHARKFAARLQAASTGDAPILLHIWENVGHGWATDREIAITEDTEWLAFVMQHVGLQPGRNDETPGVQ